VKILHVGTSDIPVLFDRGGAVQRRIWELATQQAGAGHDVVVASPGERAQSEVRDGVRIESFPLMSRRPLRDYEFLYRVRRRFGTRSGFDILHAHGSPNAARCLSGVAGRAVQSVDFFRYRGTNTRIGHRFYTKSLSRFDGILLVSHYCRAEFESFYPEIRTSREVLENGVSLTQFHEDDVAARHARSDLGLPDGDLVVYLGRVCEQKGSDLLVPVAESLARTHPSARVVAVGPPEQFGGDGPSELMEALREAGVTCTGAVHDKHLRGVLNAAAIVVLPTRRDEMFGMAALEAVACGTPVVASRLGGLPEAVGRAGRLFEVGDADAFTDCIVDLLDDPASRAEIGSLGPVHAAGFDWSAIGDRTLASYGRVSIA
jgi:glycosyltransferase involved in cell wall biosynthesis